MGQHPPPQTEVERGSTVNVTLSSGPESQEDRWKRKAVLSAVAAAVAGVAWLAGVLVDLDLRLRIATSSQLMLCIAPIGMLVALVGLHTLQAPSYGQRTGKLLSILRRCFSSTRIPGVVVPVFGGLLCCRCSAYLD